MQGFYLVVSTPDTTPMFVPAESHMFENALGERSVMAETRIRWFRLVPTTLWLKCREATKQLARPMPTILP